MILIASPFFVSLAVFAILTPRLFGLAWRAAFALAAMAIVYVADGQTSHPVFPHNYDVKSADVR